MLLPPGPTQVALGRRTLETVTGSPPPTDIGDGAVCECKNRGVAIFLNRVNRVSSQLAQPPVGRVRSLQPLMSLFALTLSDRSKRNRVVPVDRADRKPLAQKSSVDRDDDDGLDKKVCDGVRGGLKVDEQVLKTSQHCHDTKQESDLM